MNKITNPGLAALTRIRELDDFKRFTEEIKTEIEHLTDDLMVLKDEVQVRWCQGRRQALSELMFLIENAGTVLAKRQASTA